MLSRPQQHDDFLGAFGLSNLIVDPLTFCSLTFLQPARRVLNMKSNTSLTLSPVSEEVSKYDW